MRALVLPSALLMYVAACGSDDSGPAGGAVDAGVDSTSNGNDSSSATDAPSGGDSGSDSSAPDSGDDSGGDSSTGGDGGACIVLQGCASPASPSTDPYRSEHLDEACAPGNGGGALQQRCTAFCKSKTGFSDVTTCKVDDGDKTFRCYCVNP